MFLHPSCKVNIVIILYFSDEVDIQAGRSVNKHKLHNNTLILVIAIFSLTKKKNIRHMRNICNKLNIKML